MSIKTKPQCVSVAVHFGYRRMHLWQGDDMIVARAASGWGRKKM